jgi:hypothetical protein
VALGADQLGHGALLVVLGHGEDEALHDGQLVTEELVLGAAQPDALGAELAGTASVFGGVRIGPHGDAAAAEVVRPFQEGGELVGRFSGGHLERAEQHLAGATVERDDRSLGHGGVTHDHAAIAEHHAFGPDHSR